MFCPLESGSESVITVLPRSQNGQMVVKWMEIITTVSVDLFLHLIDVSMITELYKKLIRTPWRHFSLRGFYLILLRRKHLFHKA